MNLLDIVKRLEGQTNKYRQGIIVDELRNNLSVPYGFHNYTGTNGEHQFNIISRPEPRRSLEIGISSHSDAVPQSPGANDNASSVAVTLEILRRYKESPLQNVGIRGMIFDEEEKKLRGSTKYTQAGLHEGLVGLYNMELVGCGNNIVLWQSGPDHPGGPLKMSVLDATREIGVRNKVIGNIHLNSADHESFFCAGLEESYTIVAFSDEDIEMMPLYLDAQFNGERLQDLKELKSKIPVFKHYHESTDTSEHLNEESLQMVSNVLWDAVNIYDRQLAKVHQY